MSLELKVSKGYIDLTNAMISTVREKEIVFENMNLLLVQVPLVNTSTIQLVEGNYTKDHIYRAALARVIALPRLLNEVTDARVDVGDFVLYSHVGKYSISNLVIKALFGIELKDSGKPLDAVEEYNNSPIIAISDRDVMAVIKPNQMKITED